MTGTVRVLFLIGDCAAGAITGALTALAVRLVVAPDFDMVAGMMVGGVTGMVLHILIGLAFSPLLGMFETMLAGMYIGMYGGMLFGMRDAMQQTVVPLSTALWVGAIFGVMVVLTIHFWNGQMRKRRLVG